MHPDNQPDASPVPSGGVSYAAAGLPSPVGAMTMSQQQINIDLGPTSSHNDEVVVPCYAQCINLQTMHPLVQQRLMLQYKKYYVITRHATNPTPNHLGSWVKLQDVGHMLADGSREWIPASFFYTNSVIWPN